MPFRFCHVTLQLHFVHWDAHIISMVYSEWSRNLGGRSHLEQFCVRSRLNQWLILIFGAWVRAFPKILRKWSASRSTGDYRKQRIAANLSYWLKRNVLDLLSVSRCRRSCRSGISFSGCCARRMAMAETECEWSEGEVGVSGSHWRGASVAARLNHTSSRTCVLVI